MGQTRIEAAAVAGVPSDPAVLQREAGRALAEAREYKRLSKKYRARSRFSMARFAEFKAMLEADGHQVILESGPHTANQSPTPQGGASEHDSTEAN